MKIYNTMSRKKEELQTITPGEVKIYACGPTVYNYIHIGNARPLCVFDTFRRYLEYRGYKVRFVQNFTDIDDKIIKKAIEEGSDYKTVSEKYIKEYWTDTKGMNVREATVHPRATENIDEIIDIISTLVEKGYAYPVSNGDVYFSPSKFKEYGKLSHQPLEDLEAGARINVEELKKEPMDFALWKGAKPGEIAERVGKCQATIYRELERGKTGETDSRFRQGYSAAVAEARVNRSYRNRGRRKAAQ